MSVKIMAQVFQLPCLTPAEKLTLLALADHADDDGVCWPSIARIAPKCCQSQRNVRRMIRSLEQLEQLETTTSIGRPSRYRITPKPSVLRAVRPGGSAAKLSGVENGNGARTPDIAVSGDPGHGCPPNHHRTIRREEPSQEEQHRGSGTTREPGSLGEDAA